jgi:uncharacterized protein YeaO (DUF488 family)
MLRVKSVNEPRSPQDGLRVLAARYRGRYMPVSKYDVWMANLAPSEDLLKTGPENWRTFATRYRAEMLGKNTPEPVNPNIRNAGQKFTLRLLKKLAKRQNVTLMCHCPADAEQCHRFLLRDLIKSDVI